MGYILKDNLVRELNEACNEAVEALITSGYKAKIGTRSGMAYPVVSRGSWKAFLLMDTGMGWSCDLMEGIKAPHWDWFLCQNVDMVDSSLMSGAAYKLLFNHTSSYDMAKTLEFIVTEPCLIPNAVGSKGFECPECIDDWNKPQKEIGVIGRAFKHTYEFRVGYEKEMPAAWSQEILFDLFGKKTTQINGYLV